MNGLLKLAQFLGLVEEHVVSDRTEKMPSDVLIIPPGAIVEGQIHTNLAVVLAGKMDGSINIRGEAKLLVLENAEVKNGLVSADNVEIHGLAANVAIDVDHLFLSKTGRVEGKSELRYGRLAKHEDAPINGLLQKRKTPRDGFIHVARPSVDELSNANTGRLSEA